MLNIKQVSRLKKAKNLTEWSWTAHAWLSSNTLMYFGAPLSPWAIAYIHPPVCPSIHPIADTTATLKQWGLNCHTLQLTLCEIDPRSCVCSHTLFLRRSNMFSNLFSLHRPTNITRILGKIKFTGVAELALVFRTTEYVHMILSFVQSFWECTGFQHFIIFYSKKATQYNGK